MEKFINLPDEKKASIIDAALTAFGTNGYKKASISDISNAAGISKAMVFHYFGTKKALYLYLYQYCADLITSAIEESFDLSVTDFFDRIVQGSNIKISIIKKHPATISFLNSAYFESDEEVQSDIRTLMNQSDNIRNKIAFDGMDTSKFKEGIDPHLVLKMLLWMAEGFLNNFKVLDSTNIDAFCNEYFECMNLLKKNFYKDEN